MNHKKKTTLSLFFINFFYFFKKLFEKIIQTYEEFLLILKITIDLFFNKIYLHLKYINTK